LRAATLRTSPVELDCGNDDHDQGHDEGDWVEVEWNWRHGWLMGWWVGVDGLMSMG
jgi:hypothetical protein